MNKYDYGYELVDGSTNSWAFNRIPNNAVVLELGPSNGNLIYHLTTQKYCIADIVELDEESGQEAAQYARTACIGIEEGNLEKEGWYQRLSKNQYDCIIVLDVLEHIRNPKEVLILLSSLLKKEGKLLLSVPNIAHNSVLINLLQNKLEYTSVGLLDNTHVHFYTYDSILQLLKEAGLKVECCEVKQVAVNNNEIDAVYGLLPREVEAYLKTRKQGTAYQFLLTVSVPSDNTEDKPTFSYKKDTLYKIAAFDENGSLLIEKKINPLEKVQLEIPVVSFGARIRIDPLDTNCIISNIKLIGKRQDKEDAPLLIAENTGNQFDDKYVFYDDDPQLYINVPADIRSLLFSCDVDVFDNSALAELAPSRDIFRQAHIDYVQVRDLYEKAEKIAGELQASLQKANVSNEQLQLEKKQKNKELEVAEADIRKLQEKLLNAHEKMVSINQSLEQKDSDIAALQDKLQQANETVQILHENLVHANNSIAELQKELNDMLTTIWGKIYYKLNK